MAEHLSALVLDELAAGLPVAPADARHAKECAPCAQRLDALHTERAQIAASPRFEEAFTAAVARGKVVPLRRRALAVAAPLLALAAAAAVFVLRPPARPLSDGDRLKGGPSVELLSQAGAPVTSARVGDTLTLAVGSAGFAHALVLAVDARGELTVLWPAGLESEPLPPGARVRLGAGFQVTPGDVEVLALFSDEPISRVGAYARFAGELARARREGRPPLEAVLEPLPGERGRARVRLSVTAP